MDNKADTNPVQKLQKLELERRTAELKELFLKMDNVVLRKFPVQLFERFFLPFFCGEFNQEHHRIIGEWIKISGSVYNPVNLINEAGEVVAKVPPINDNTIFTPITDRKIDMGWVVKEAKEKAAISPVLANTIIVNALHERIVEMLKDRDKSTVAKEWIELFKYFGKVTNDQFPQLTQKTNATEQDDEFEW